MSKEMTARHTLQTFDLGSLPNLDVAVLGALERFAEGKTLPGVAVPFEHPLIIGSAGARATAEIVFAERNAVFADESNYERILSRGDFDGAVIISASGGKHAVGIAQTLKGEEVPTVLFTNTEDAPAAAYVPDDSVRLFPKNREPYTYNTSTYMGMILAATKEDPDAIMAHLAGLGTMPSLGGYGAFTFILPRSFALIAPLVHAKFDELFGPMLVGRVFTEEEIKHAKTVVPSPKECFIAIGNVNDIYGAPEQRLAVPLPQEAGYAAMMAIAYFIVGKIQAAHPPYFKDNIEAYAQQASTLFEQEIDPIVA